MFRTRAVRQLLTEDVAGLPRASDSSEQADQLARARRRAIGVIALDWAAILILVIARARSGGMFEIGPTEDGLFSLGLLAIAAHSGFRLGQLEKIQAVTRALSELDGRSKATGSETA